MADRHEVRVDFKAVGNKNLEIALKQLAASQTLLRRGVKAYEAELKRLNLQQRKYSGGAAFATTGNRLLSNSFATLRSSMLLYSFAMGLGVRQTISFAKQSAKVKSMEVAFTDLVGGTNKATEGLVKLRQATDGTMSDFDLFQQANNAMILGVSKNSDEMADLFDMAQRLGEALGKDTKESVESLVTGIGRQSRLMLDNIGIVVKSEEAYQDYAKELGVSADKLSDADKKQAFLNATLDSARKKLSNLSPETMTVTKQFLAFNASAQNASKELGEAFLPMILPTTRALTDFFNALDAEDLKLFAKALRIGALAYGSYHVWAKAAALSNYLFATSFKKTGIGAAVMAGSLAVGVAIESFLNYIGAIDDTGIAVADASLEFEKLKKQLEDQTETHKDLNTIQKESIHNLIFEKAILSQESEVLKEVLKLQKERAEIGATPDITTTDVSEDEIALIQEIFNLKSEIAEKERAMRAEQREEEAQEGEARKIILEGLKETSKGSIKLQNDELARIEVLRENDLLNKDQYEAAKLAIDKKYLSKEQAIRQQRIAGFFEVAQALGRAAMVGAEAGKASEKTRKRIAVASAVLDAFAGAQKAWRANAENPLLAGTMYGITLATGLAQAKIINDQKIESSSLSGGTGGGTRQIVFGQPAPMFADGGLIGGRPHSRGGTMINAERGEFIMSKNAVDSIGLDTLNNLNQGGTAVTVNVSGNVMTQDFVDNDLADAIKDSIRRGSDFGLE